MKRTAAISTKARSLMPSAAFWARRLVRRHGIVAAAMAAGLMAVTARGAAADGAHLFLPIVETGSAPTPPVTAAPGRGLFAQPVLVTLSSEAVGAAIRFTADGSPPTADYGLPYEGPVLVDRTTVLRARAFVPGEKPSAVTTFTYIFPEQVLQQRFVPDGFPRSWGEVDGHIVPADYEMDPEVVRDPLYGPRLAADLAALPTVSLAASVEDMFGPNGIYANPIARGPEWERRASFELLEPGGSGIQADASLRIAGEASRHPSANQKHSFALKFRGEYGTRKLRYPLFPGSSVSTFERLRLRAGQADTFEFFPGKAQYVHDAWARQTFAAMGHSAARSRFVHLYVNGLYWGLYDLSEEVDAEFASQYLGGDEAEYDVIKKDVNIPPRADEGDLTAFDTMMAIPDLHTSAGYEALQQHLDVVEYADYTLLELFGANRDWPENNWIAVRRKAAGAKFTFHVWDMEQMTQLWRYDGLEDRIDMMSAGAAGLHGRLIENPEYRVLFGDRVHRHLVAGALSPGESTERYRRLAEAVVPGIVAESARWGDAKPGTRAYAQNKAVWDQYWYMYGRGHPQTFDEQWVPERDRILGGFFAERAGAVIDQFERRGLYPSVEAPTLVKSGNTLRLSVPYGKLYFTVDGTDPRRTGGSVSPGAQVYKGPRVIDGYARVLARAEHDGVWSAVVEAVFGTPMLAMTEIMYHPAEGGPEFLELFNPSPSGVVLGGASFAEGIDYTFPAGAELPPGRHWVIASDAAAFAARYPGAPLGGVFANSLANDGEPLRLLTPDGALLAQVTYDDEGLWPIAADGFGRSLVPLAGAPLSPDAWHPEQWVASRDLGGSPGREDTGTARTVVISEVLASSRGAYEDAIEVLSTSDRAVNIGGWYLSDSRSSAVALRKFRIPEGTVLDPGATKVFYETDFGGGPSGFALSADGEGAYLTEFDPAGRPTGRLTGLEFGPSEPNQSFGRVATSAGVQTARLERPTFGVDDPVNIELFRKGAGAPNSGPRIGPVVISELLASPQPGGQEFIELYNRSDAAVALFAEGNPNAPWVLAGGVDFTLPAATILAPGGRLVVAGEDPARLRREARISLDVPVFGPFSGGLEAESDEVLLLRPVAGGVTAPLIEEDRAFYRAAPPWPRRSAPGTSLERQEPPRFGAEPSSWVAVALGGTPGRAASAVWRALLPFVHTR